MTWGDGDCNNDFNLGEHWFIAGYEMEGKINSNLHSNAAQQMLKQPIRATK